MKNIGKVVQVIGPVVDIRFEDGQLPKLYNAIKIDKGNGEYLVVEVAQHIGDDVARCISMGSTDGLVRQMDCEDTGAPISVPVGEKVLGRMFNVLGQEIDGLPPIGDDVTKMPIHRPAPSFAEQQTSNHHWDSPNHHQPENPVTIVLKIRDKIAFECSFDNFPNSFAKIYHHRKNRPQMHCHIKSNALILKSRKFRKQNQMSR